MTLLISSQTKIKSRQRKYVYKASFSALTKISRKYFWDKLEFTEVEKLIEKFIFPVRKGRSSPRKFSPKRKECFMYR